MRSLLALSLLAFLGSIGAWLALPSIGERLRTARAKQALHDLQTFATAFQKFAHDRGDWPPGTAAPGNPPPGMEQALANSAWSKVSPIGGKYVWLTDTVQRGHRPHAVIAIVSTTDHRIGDRREVEQLLRDARAAGLSPVRLGFRDEPIWILE